MAWYNRCSFSSLLRLNDLRQAGKSELVNQDCELPLFRIYGAAAIHTRRTAPKQAALVLQSQALRRFQ
jgi:hypothetical protein